MKTLLRYLIVILFATPSLAIASDFTGFAEILFIMFVIYPILAIENIVIIVMGLYKKFKNKGITKKAIVIVGVTLFIGFIVVIKYSYTKRYDGDAFLLVYGLLSCSIIALMLPILQYKYLKNKNA